jgi:hypothetical protein
VIGSVLYSVVVDGQLKAHDIHGLGYHLRTRGLGDGTHLVRVLATDSTGQQTMSAAGELEVDANPPAIRLRRLSGRRVQVRVHDGGPGARAGSTVISFGDGSRSVRGAQVAVHRYPGSGRYLITVRCADMVGNGGVDHLWVQVR